MRRLLFASISASLLGACMPQHDDAAKSVAALPDMPSILTLDVLDSVSEANTHMVDSAVTAGNAYDLAVAFHYYFHMSASDKSVTRRAIEVYDSLKSKAPENYGSVLYDVSKDLERRNYGRMVDRHVEYLRSVGDYEPDGNVESVSR